MQIPFLGHATWMIKFGCRPDISNIVRIFTLQVIGHTHGTAFMAKMWLWVVDPRRLKKDTNLLGVGRSLDGGCWGYRFFTWLNDLFPVFPRPGARGRTRLSVERRL